MSTLILVPAYGRDYKSQKAVLDDYLANKDFTICQIGDRHDGKLCDRESLVHGGIVSHVNIRFARMTKIARFKVEGRKP